MESLGIEVITHMPADSDGNRTTARSKGKVERPFRTVNEAHEAEALMQRVADDGTLSGWIGEAECDPLPEVRFSRAVL